MMKAGKIVGALTIATVFAIAGCAEVKIRKVPTPTQYVHWTDLMQYKADNIKGFRFYLPRPFINVFESFPIRTDIYIADGVVSPDGKYVIIKRVRDESGLTKYMAGEHDGGAYIAKRDISVPEIAKDIAKAQAGVEDEARKKAEEKAKATVPTGGGQEPSAEPIPVPRMTGINKRRVTNDNAAFAYQPLRGNFDIVYMPDFEEQYAVYSWAGLGNAEFEVNLGQGWSLQGFNSLTDNSELNKRIFDMIDTSIKMAKTAGSAAIGIPPVPQIPPGVTDLFKAQAGREMEEKDGVPGSPVSLKIVVVHYAAKGLYPVIKPRELQERMVTTIKASGAFNMFLDMFRSSPLWIGSNDYDPTAIQRAQQAIDNETGRYTVPRYPYQYVSFNTFRYMAIEVIKTDTQPFDILYDKTGTKGDPGDRQAADVRSSIVALIDRMLNPKPTATHEGKDVYADAANILKGKSFKLNGTTISITEASAKEKSVFVTLSVSNKPTDTITEATLKSELLRLVSDYGFAEDQIETNYKEIEDKLKAEKSTP
ncbi:MAG: hypothetical protein NG747_16355 [Candidatus Brocadia sp.]|nr:hypothetical protein [Candidatus Brocadia sp.]